MKLIFLIVFLFSTFLFGNEVLKKNTLYLKSKHSFEYAGYYIAKEKGFYKDIGLDIKIKESKTNINTSKLVLNDENSFGVSDSILIYEKMMGKKVSLLGAIFQHSPLVFLTLVKSEVYTPKDFENKRIMLDFELENDALVNTIIKKYNLDSKNIKKIQSSHDINDLILEKTDVLVSSLSSDIYPLLEKEIQYNYIYPANFGFDFYGDILFTSDKNMKKNPKLVKEFYEASLKGWKYAFNNIDETISLILKKYNEEGFSYEKYLYEAKVLKDLSEIEKGNLGKLDLKRINNILSAYYISEHNESIEDLSIFDINLLVKLINKPFYEMNMDQIRDIFEVFLQKDYIISLQLYDKYLDEIVYQSWKEGTQIFHKEVRNSSKRIEKTKIYKEKSIYVNNKEIGYLRIYYKDKTDFTVLEQDYLLEKKVLTFCTKNNYKPYSFFEEGEYKGILVDFIKTLKSKINTEIKVVKTKDWEECLSLVNKGKIDFSSLLLSESNTYKNITPTKSYIQGYIVLSTKIDEPFIFDIEKINNNIIGINKHSKNVKRFIEIEYPQLKIKEFNSTKEGLEAILDNKIYAYADISGVIAYAIQSEYPFQLKIMNRLDKSEQSGIMGVKDGNNLLLSILNKGIDLVSDKTKREIKNSWISIKQEKNVDYGLIWKIVLFTLFLFLAFLYRQYLLNKVNRDLKTAVREELRKNREKDKLLFQQSKLASMGEMLNNIAHQWRQPLNAINSNVAVLDSLFMKKNIMDDRLEKNLTEIESQTKYMSETIESFRNFFNPEKDKQFFLISKAVDDAVSIVKFNLNRLDIKIKVFIVNDILIEAYYGEYLQTIISILNNSRDAFSSKSFLNPEILICIDDMVMIEDNAGGIDSKIIDRIFEPYFTTKHKDKGTGTGLYIAKMIIEHSMNGELSVENIKNGCRFKIKV